LASWTFEFPDPCDLLRQLMAFVTAGEVETMLEDTLLFPYPFAGLSKQRIWWEEFLQTVKVRYQYSNKLTRLFDIPDHINAPIFIFVKKGDPLKNYKTIQASQRPKFTTWMWDNLIVKNVTIVNLHKNEVDIYWVHDDQVQYKSTLPPDQVVSFDAKLSHTFWVRDSRVNSHLKKEEISKMKAADRLSENSTIQVIQILEDQKDQTFEIEIKRCMDLPTKCRDWLENDYCNEPSSLAISYSKTFCKKTCGKCSALDDYKAQKERNQCKDHEGYCQIWARQGECENNQAYMNRRCPFSCKVCTPKNNKPNETDVKWTTRKKNERRKKNEKKVIIESSDDSDEDLAENSAHKDEQGTIHYNSEDDVLDFASRSSDESDDDEDSSDSSDDSDDEEFERQLHDEF
jgi:ShK domain-like